ncbi:Shedu immune nuclease family protein [Mesorhizobium sp. WSM3859]|uniref:Shedu immune nuclease family protein n=1 Tax=Mesorhizobium sp. WSM3859 TaxID=2029402 RepID=UPI000BAF7C11|nr:Shedu immune nuclease family protein [Mesorhizobium sp. WSM3859]PBC06479.1 hypothetical protein CK230_31490 [Mesorhizobium sp. WSM3859]
MGDDDYDERARFFNRRTDKTIVDKEFVDGLTRRKMRIASHVLEGSTGLAEATVVGETVLRETRAARQEIKATFYVDDRSVQTLTIQRFNRSGPSEKQRFSFVGSEINTLLEFIAGIRTASLDGGGTVHLSDEEVRNIILNQGQAHQLFRRNPALFLELAEQDEAVTRDLHALGYRRKELRQFERLLHDGNYFASEQSRLNCRPEDVWQKFFEANTWIFGYGLSYQFLSKLDERKLEQVVLGNSVVGPGKRVDGLMKTRGRINSLCFVEIKRHDTPLLGQAMYRPGAFAPSSEVSGGVAQVQATVHAAIHNLGEKFATADASGDPTGETLFNIQPRSCLVVGTLAEFETQYGINEQKFRSFELYRRNIWRPEIVTFDELLERARFIVEPA